MLRLPPDDECLLELTSLGYRVGVFAPFEEAAAAIVRFRRGAGGDPRRGMSAAGCAAVGLRGRLWRGGGWVRSVAGKAAGAEHDDGRMAERLAAFVARPRRAPLRNAR